MTAPRWMTGLWALLLSLTAGCAGCPARPGTPDAGAGSQSVSVVAAGDIAGPWEEDEATARLVDTLNPDVILGLGDLAYNVGSRAEYTQHYVPTWGRHREKTLPAPGNHEHGTPELAGYCDYFGAKASCRNGFAWYATDIGSWRVLSLDSGAKTPGSDLDPMVEGSPQRTWLREELAKNARRCTLVFWHHPRFSSGAHGSDVRSQAIWEELHKAGVDVVLNGHDHHYERFFPLAPSGERDEAKGITQFIVGTGGAPLYPFDEGPHPQTAIRQTQSHGVLQLTLEEGAFAWRFVPVPGHDFQDSGRANCH